MNPSPPLVHSSLLLIARIWVERRDVCLSCPELNATAYLYRGEAASPYDLKQVVKMMASSQLEARPITTSQHGMAHGLSHHLWLAAGTLADDERIRQRLSERMSPTRGTMRATRHLPLKIETMRLLRDRATVPISMKERIHLAKCEASVVIPDLSRLFILGLIEFSPVTRQSRLIQSLKQMPSSRPLIRVRARDEQLILRLQRAWEAVDGADDWSVLGATPDMTPAQISHTYMRLRRHYRDLLHDPETPEVHRELARRLLSRIEAAAVRLRLSASPQPPQERDT